MPPNDIRLYHSIWKKISAYKNLVEKYCVPYVISLYGDFSAVIDTDELRACLYDGKTGLFGMYSIISGVLFFEENAGKYQFNYFTNPNAIRKIKLPAQTFP